MEDSSLDDFLASESAEDEAADTPEADESPAAEQSGEADAPGDVEQATSTARFHPDGVACDSCGETAQRCWQSEDGHVCPDCKEW